ncbi:hypothetical protein J437_LFUL002290 [Ladona fulva]|uniref:Uncharacterized protein n=1 Tax=Ladona fulva TaxID=123851 RepID=A0A8K0JXB9_LADFU|nr:hypothetical protein J437_LFUL002290 [Ladona fulva]
MENTNEIDDTISLPEYNETTKNVKIADELEEGSTKDQKERRETQCYEYIASWKIFNIGYWWWPTLDDVLWKATVVVIMLLIWGAAYASTGRLAEPGGAIFNLGIILITAHAAAVLGSYIAIPQIISMLLAGVILKNMKVIDIYGTLHKEVLGQIRCSALTLILIRAGLGLDPAALKRLGLGMICLSFIPCITELIGEAVIAHFTLKLPFLWSLLLGSTLCAVSPAVVVNYLLALKENGYGVSKGIPTLIVAAASMDDIVAISVFGIVASILFSKGSVIMRALQGPIEIVVGLVSGIILGAIATVLPHETNFEMVGAGYITSIVSSFTASLGWRICNWNEWEKPLQHGFNVAWNVMQHFLFALIGYELDFKKLDWSDTLLQISTFGAGLLVSIECCILQCISVTLSYQQKILCEQYFIPSCNWS